MNYTDKGDYRRLREIIIGKSRQRRSSIGEVSLRKPLVNLEENDDDEEEEEQEEEKPKKRTSTRRSTTAATRPRSVSRDRDRRKSRNETRSPSPPIQMLSKRARSKINNISVKRKIFKR
jgi:hypothetical protein